MLSSNLSPELTVVVSSLSCGGAERIVLDWIERSYPRFRVELIVISNRVIEYEVPPFVTVTRLQGDTPPQDQYRQPTEEEILLKLSKLKEVGSRISKKEIPVVVCHLLSGREREALSFGGAQVIPVLHNAKSGWGRSADGIAKGASIISVSQSAKEEMLKDDNSLNVSVVRHIPKERVCDVSIREKMRGLWGIPQDAKVIGMIGTVRHQKNYGLALKVLKVLLEEVDCYLVIVGSSVHTSYGNLAWKDLVEDIKVLGLSDRVILTGTLPDAAQYLPVFDVMFNTSHFEGLSIATLEALMSGKVVVAAKVGGQGELSSQGLLLVEKEASLLVWKQALMQAFRLSAEGVSLPSWKSLPTYKLWTLASLSWTYPLSNHVLFVLGDEVSFLDVDFLHGLRDEKLSYSFVTRSQDTYKYLLQKKCEVVLLEEEDYFDEASVVLYQLIKHKTKLLYFFKAESLLKHLVVKNIRNTKLVIFDYSTKQAKKSDSFGYDVDSIIAFTEDDFYKKISKSFSDDNELLQKYPEKITEVKKDFIKNNSDKYAYLQKDLIYSFFKKVEKISLEKEKPLSVLVVLGQYPVLSETFILTQIVGLIKRGHTVSICSLYGFPYSLIDKKSTLIDEHRLTEKVLPPFHKKKLLCSFLFPTKEDLLCVKRSLKSKKWYVLPFLWMYRFIFFSFKIETSHEKSFSFDKNGYDIIHCQFGNLAEQVLVYKKRGILKGKLVVSFRGSDISKYVEEKGYSIYKSLFQEADYFLPVCEGFKQRAIDLGCDPKKIEVHHTGLDSKKFSFKEIEYPHTGEIKVISIGRLVEKKGIEYSIRAMAYVVKRFPNIHYTIVGDGELRASLWSLVKELKLARYITLIGWREHSESIQLMRKSHIFISPNVVALDGNSDGLPNTIKEAMALGVPVITTRHKTIEELVVDSLTGFVVPQYDSKAIADKIIFLLENKDIWEKVTYAARKKIEQEHDEEHLSDDLVKIYRRLISL